MSRKITKKIAESLILELQCTREGFSDAANVGSENCFCMIKLPTRLSFLVLLLTWHASPVIYGFSNPANTGFENLFWMV